MVSKFSTLPSISSHKITGEKHKDVIVVEICDDDVIVVEISDDDQSN